MTSESTIMRFFKSIGLDRIAWSLRRLYCPVDKDALVLEVGSGGNPYPRANVLLDAYENTRERHWVPLKVDRPMVLGFVEKLPFKDKTFDFVIASHVLEHSADPKVFLTELQRVAKAGYIETPDAFFERINPYRDHRLEVTERQNRLLIRKKSAWNLDPDTVELYEYKAKQHLTNELISRRPFYFHLRYYWKNTIDYEIINPDENSSWPATASGNVSCGTLHKSFTSQVKNTFLNIYRNFFSQKRRNAEINLFDFLMCPHCSSASIQKKSPSKIECCSCKSQYEIRGDIPVMIDIPWIKDN